MSFNQPSSVRLHSPLIFYQIHISLFSPPHPRCLRQSLLRLLCTGICHDRISREPCIGVRPSIVSRQSHRLPSTIPGFHSRATVPIRVAVPIVEALDSPLPRRRFVGKAPPYKPLRQWFFQHHLYQNQNPRSDKSCPASGHMM